MASKDSTTTSDSLPFGSMAPPPGTRRREGEGSGDGAKGDGSSSRPRRSRRRRSRSGPRPDADRTDAEGSEAKAAGEGAVTEGSRSGAGSQESENGVGGGQRRRRNQRRRKNRNKKGGGDGEGGGGGGGGQRPAASARPGGQRGAQRGAQRGGQREATGEVEGWLVLDKGSHGQLRTAENGFLPKKHDVHVAPRFVQKFQLRDGALIKGRYGKGHGKHKNDLVEIETVDGRKPDDVRSVPVFKKLTSITPDFHYAVGDLANDTDLRIVDLICPVGRGQRGLIVAPPRSGKTVLLQKFAHAIEEHYTDVELMVLLVDERPEEATEWKRSLTRGHVFVSTNDEMPKTHVELAESVWRRCQRLVELGQDVVLLLDSITRLARAYNHVKGTSGKTMSGGIDARTMERPKQFFGSARNTETAGSLTILGTTLIETGSRMDQVIFEEFKGTGNMELVLSRRLADRRIFPAIDIERSGTRKEERMISTRKLRLVNTLRRVLHRMHWAEAMELLVSKLDDVTSTDEFLSRFEIDPEE